MIIENLRVVDFTDETFKTDWSNIEIAGVETVLSNMLAEEIGDGESFDAPRQLGTAYTSSSAYAMLNFTAPFEVDEESGESLEYAALTHNGMLIVHTCDNEDNWRQYEVGNEYF